jgi:hypothetical protein
VPYIGQDLQVAFPSYTNIDDISGSFDGVTTSFPLTVGGVAPVPAPLGSNQCLISVDGVVQRPDDTGTEGFRLSGGNIIFSSAPSIADDFFGIILAGADYVNVGANFPDGTLGAPSITFDQDNDTGYYRSGSGAVSFASNGVAAGTWSSAGVTAPALIPTGSSVPANGVYLPAANTVGVATNGTGRLFVDANGNVGVGTSSISTFGGYTTLEINNGTSGAILDLSQGDVMRARFVAVTTSATIETSGSIPFLLSPGGTEKLRVTSGGLVGIGTSAPSNLLTLNAPNANALTLFVGVNTGEYSSIRGKYGAGNDFAQSEIRFINADNPNGRGALAFAVGTNSTTEHMRITYDGKVGIGDSAPDALLVIKGNSDANTTPSIRLKDGTDTREAWITNSAGDLALNVGGDDNVPHGTLKLFEGGTLTYAQGAGERLRIDSSGRLLVGTSSAITNLEPFITPSHQFVGNDSTTGGGMLVLGKTAHSALYLSRGQSGNAVASGDLIGRVSFTGYDGGQYSRFAAIGCEADDGVSSNDSPGRLVFSTTADGASTPGERMRITSGGNVLVGKTSSSFGTGDGTVIGGAGYLAQTRTSATPFTVIRNGTDGTLVSFEAQNVEEGTISVSGTTVSYNGAHLSRWSQILGIDPYNKAVRPEILRGTVMSNLDEMCDWTCPTSGDCQDNEQLNKTKISDVEGDKNVAGIFQSWDDDDDTWVNDYYLAMTGDFVIRIAAGTTVERGDLLMSAGDGTAKPQADDLVRSCTVAKVTSANVSCTYDDGSYCVPCVLMAC